MKQIHFYSAWTTSFNLIHAAVLSSAALNAQAL